jgi:HlyD family secretion protein
VKQAESDVERKTRKAKATIAQAGASKAAKQAEYDRQLEKLEKYVSQLEKTKIYAPEDGTIIYATSAEQSQHRHGSHTEPLKVGNSVQERQDLLHLPTTSGFVVNISIPESNLSKVKVGLPTRVAVDAIPSDVFTGVVSSVSSVVNAQTNFMNPDLKLYDVVITLEDDSKKALLRSGMTCTAEIIIDQFENAVYVPIEAVMSVSGKPTVYVVKGDKVKPRTVETGLENNTVIMVSSGLNAGELITLAPPLAQAEVVE